MNNIIASDISQNYLPASCSYVTVISDPKICLYSCAVERDVSRRPILNPKTVLKRIENVGRLCENSSNGSNANDE